MKVLPVLDISRGIAVHAIAGERARYRPVESVLAPSADPLDLARGFRDRLGLSEIYLADLDSIGGEEPAWELYRALIQEDLTLMVDAGVKDRHLALGLREAGVRSVVAGLETLRGPEQIPELVEGIGPRSLVLGLDLRGGSPMGDSRVWGMRDASAIAGSAHAKGVSRFLVLDLSRVGTGQGPPLDALCAVAGRLKAADLLAGGGVRGIADLRALAAAGATGALVATALHDGSLDRAALEEAARLRPGRAELA
jgi:HisA/HisF family protein